MKPNDLLEFSRQAYSKPGDAAYWSSPEVVDQGLRPEELALLGHLPFRQGRLLLLGLGGGREAIPLAKAGFEVTGVDVIPAMIPRAQANAARHGVPLECLVQDYTRLEVAPESYDVIWISRGMYSSVPTRAQRIAVLQRIHKALKPDGYLLCQFLWGPNSSPSGRGIFIRRLIAVITWGNRSYEPGDVLWNNAEFVHYFQREDELRSEFAAAGLRVVNLTCSESRHFSEAVLARS